MLFRRSILPASASARLLAREFLRSRERRRPENQRTVGVDLENAGAQFRSSPVCTTAIWCSATRRGTSRRAVPLSSRRSRAGSQRFVTAELAAMIPVSGSAYTYSYATLGEIVAWIIGWDLILEYAVGNMAVAKGWSDYFVKFFCGESLQREISALAGNRSHNGHKIIAKAEKARRTIRHYAAAPVGHAIAIESSRVSHRRSSDGSSDLRNPRERADQQIIVMIKIAVVCLRDCVWRVHG